MSEVERYPERRVGGRERRKGSAAENARRRDSEAQQYRILEERALDQANRDSEVELRRASARLATAKAVVLEDLHRVVLGIMDSSVTADEVEKLLKALKEEKT